MGFTTATNGSTGAWVTPNTVTQGETTTSGTSANIVGTAGSGESMEAYVVATISTGNTSGTVALYWGISSAGAPGTSIVAGCPMIALAQ